MENFIVECMVMLSVSGLRHNNDSKKDRKSK